MYIYNEEHFNKFLYENVGGTSDCEATERDKDIDDEPAAFSIIKKGKAAMKRQQQTATRVHVWK